MPLKIGFISRVQVAGPKASSKRRPKGSAGIQSRYAAQGSNRKQQRSTRDLDVALCDQVIFFRNASRPRLPDQRLTNSNKLVQTSLSQIVHGSLSHFPNHSLNLGRLYTQRHAIACEHYHPLSRASGGWLSANCVCYACIHHARGQGKNYLCIYTASPRALGLASPSAASPPSYDRPFRRAVVINIVIGGFIRCKSTIYAPILPLKEARPCSSLASLERHQTSSKRALPYSRFRNQLLEITLACY